MDLNDAFYYDITEESFKKLALRFNAYIENYEKYLNEFAIKEDGNEKSYCC
jgi:hypothetical protein